MMAHNKDKVLKCLEPIFEDFLDDLESDDDDLPSFVLSALECVALMCLHIQSKQFITEMRRDDTCYLDIIFP